MAFRPAQRRMLGTLLGTVVLFTIWGFQYSQSNLQAYFQHETMLGNNILTWMEPPQSSSLSSLSLSLSSLSVQQDAQDATTTTTSTTATSRTLFFDQTYNNHDDDDDMRRWGCALTQTPAVFIHVGKMGGGTVRARFAAAALDYNRTHWHNSSDTSAYYPIRPPGDDDNNNNHYTKNATSQRGYFCNSGLHNYRYTADKRTFEGTHICRALSPIGQAIACPGTIRDSFSNGGKKCYGCPIHGTTCHRIYVGHNLLGNEIHHLPPQYLMSWWKTTWEGRSGNGRDDESPTTKPTTTRHATNTNYSSSLAQLWDLLQVDNRAWCPMLQRARPETFALSNQFFESCAVPLGQHVDRVAMDWAASAFKNHAVWQRRQVNDNNITTTNNRIINNNIMNNLPSSSSSSLLDWDLLTFNWGPIYASLPALRTIVVREPFGWLLSKYSWHRHARFYTCDNVTAATYRPYYQTTELPHYYPPTKALGWAHNHALYYLLQLCGEDCQVRWEHAVATLGDSFTVDHEKTLLHAMERQADYNLRYSIAVVGIQNDMDGFYDMVSARVAYLNMSRNAHVEGPRHPSNPTEDCRAVFDSSSFRQAMIQASPAIAAMVRLHETAVQVNAFQKRELENCG